MRLTRILPTLLRLPRERSVALPLVGRPVAPTPLSVLLIQLDTDAGVSGLGFGCFAEGGRSLVAAIEDDLTPLVVGENALNHERLWAKSRTLESAAARQAYAAVDLALWDLKAKAAGLPLWRMLGGVRESAKCFTAETAMPGLTTDEIINRARSAKDQGISGLRVNLPGIDPKAESDLLVAVHDSVGEDVWYAVTIERPYDYETALPMGRFIEEEIGADWLEDPLADDDLAGYARLGSRIDTPLATGGRFTSPAQFLRLLESGATTILRPDVIRLGGLTPWLKVAALAELHRRPIVPHLLPEVAVHLACGLPGVQAVEYVAWLAPIFVEPLRIENGNVIPPLKPGLGLELNGDAVKKYSV